MLFIAIRHQGWLFLNDRLSTRINPAHNMEQGDVIITSAFLNEETHNTGFRNFNVWTAR